MPVRREPFSILSSPVSASETRWADIGDVHNVLDFVAIEFEDAKEDVLKDVGAEVADMGVVVDGQATGVDADIGWIEGFKFAEGAGVGVVEFEGHIVSNA